MTESNLPSDVKSARRPLRVSDQPKMKTQPDVDGPNGEQLPYHGAEKECEGSNILLCLVCSELIDNDSLECTKCQIWSHIQCVPNNGYQKDDASFICFLCDDGDSIISSNFNSTNRGNTSRSSDSKKLTNDNSNILTKLNTCSRTSNHCEPNIGSNCSNLNSSNNFTKSSNCVNNTNNVYSNSNSINVSCASSKVNRDSDSNNVTKGTKSSVPKEKPNKKVTKDVKRENESLSEAITQISALRLHTEQLENERKKDKEAIQFLQAQINSLHTHTNTDKLYSPYSSPMPTMMGSVPSPPPQQPYQHHSNIEATLRYDIIREKVNSLQLQNELIMQKLNTFQNPVGVPPPFFGFQQMQFPGASFQMPVQPPMLPMFNPIPPYMQGYPLTQGHLFQNPATQPPPAGFVHNHQSTTPLPQQQQPPPAQYNPQPPPQQTSKVNTPSVSTVDVKTGTVNDNNVYSLSEPRGNIANSQSKPPSSMRNEISTQPKVAPHTPVVNNSLTNGVSTSRISTSDRARQIEPPVSFNHASVLDSSKSRDSRYDSGSSAEPSVTPVMLLRKVSQANVPNVRDRTSTHFLDLMGPATLER